MLKHSFILCILLFIMLCMAGMYFVRHLKPFTQNAFVFANTRPVSVLTDGFITQIHVKNNQQIKKGDPIFTVFQEPLKLKAEILTHRIAGQKARIDALTSRINAAESETAKLAAELANNRFLSEKANFMLDSNAVSETYAEERQRAKESSESALSAARHRTEALRHSRREAEAVQKELESEFKLTQVYLELTVVRALSDGIVTNMSISPGGYYHPGNVLCGFIDTSEWFIQANFKESELSEIHAGQRAKIWLRQYPDAVLKGEVTATGWSAERRKTDHATGLPVVESENEWFLLPQRFPVQIRITEYPAEIRLHPGASAFVEIDTLSHPVRQFFWQIFLWD